VDAITSSQIVECSGHAQNRGPRVRTKQRKSIQKRNKNGKRSNRIAVETEPEHKKEEKKVNISRNETKQIDSE
jgi:hypothetical protein